jgi:hypothetical protein
VNSIRMLDKLGRVRLSQNFWMREFLYSEVANLHGIPNVPDDPDLAIEAGTRLCTELLEPLQRTFGKVLIRSAYRSCTVNGFCNEQMLLKKGGYTCASNQKNYADHIWDRRDSQGNMGATACIVIPWFADRFENTEWRKLAWWIHDHLPYSSLFFFPKMSAFNIQWREQPERWIQSYIEPKGYLTRRGMPNHDGLHRSEYEGLPDLA